MPSLWLPGAAAEAILNEQSETETAFVRRLKTVDPRLGMFRAQADDPENDLRAGFYYVYRHNENGTVAFYELVHPVHGGFYEPDEAVIEAFRRWDANTHGSTAQDREHRRESERKAREKRQEDWKERKRDELKDEADYMFRTQMAVRDGVLGSARKGQG